MTKELTARSLGALVVFIAFLAAILALNYNPYSKVNKLKKRIIKIEQGILTEKTIRDSVEQALDGENSDLRMQVGEAEQTNAHLNTLLVAYNEKARTSHSISKLKETIRDLNDQIKDTGQVAVFNGILSKEGCSVYLLVTEDYMSISGVNVDDEEVEWVRGQKICGHRYSRREITEKAEFQLSFLDI